MKIEIKQRSIVGSAIYAVGKVYDSNAKPGAPDYIPHTVAANLVDLGNAKPVDALTDPAPRQAAATPRKKKTKSPA